MKECDEKCPAYEAHQDEGGRTVHKCRAGLDIGYGDTSRLHKIRPGRNCRWKDIESPFKAGRESMRQYARGEGMTYKLEHLVCTTRFCEYRGEWCEFLGYNTEIMDWLCEKYDQAALNLNTDGRCLRLKQCRADHPGASYQRRVV